MNEADWNECEEHDTDTAVTPDPKRAASLRKTAQYYGKTMELAVAEQAIDDCKALLTTLDPSSEQQPI